MSERRILTWMCVLIAVNQLGFGAVIPVLPLYAQSFGVSQAAIGATVAVYGLSRVLLSVPTGWIANRFGRRAALLVGGLASAFGNLWCALAGSYEELVIARFAAGAGAGIVLTAGMIVLADITRPATRGRTMAIYQGVFLFAVGIGPFPGGYLAERLSLDAPFPGLRCRQHRGGNRGLVRRIGNPRLGPRSRGAVTPARCAAYPTGGTRRQRRLPARLPDRAGQRRRPHRRAVQHRPRARPGPPGADGDRNRLRLRPRQHHRPRHHLPRRRLRRPLRGARPSSFPRPF